MANDKDDPDSSDPENGFQPMDDDFGDDFSSVPDAASGEGLSQTPSERFADYDDELAAFSSGDDDPLAAADDAMPDPGFAAYASDLEDPLADWPSPDAPLEELPEVRQRTEQLQASVDAPETEPTSSSDFRELGEGQYDINSGGDIPETPPAAEVPEPSPPESVSAPASVSVDPPTPDLSPEPSVETPPSSPPAPEFPPLEPTPAQEVVSPVSDDPPSVSAPIVDDLPKDIEVLTKKPALDDEAAAAPAPTVAVEPETAAVLEAMAKKAETLSENSETAVTPSAAPQTQTSFGASLLDDPMGSSQADDDEFVDDFLNDLDDIDDGFDDGFASNNGFDDSDSTTVSSSQDPDDKPSIEPPAAITAAVTGLTTNAVTKAAAAMDDASRQEAPAPRERSPEISHEHEVDDTERKLPVAMIAVVVVAVVLLAVGGYGVVQQRGEMETEIRDLQARLATTLTPEEAAMERERVRQVELESETLRSDMAALTTENSTLREQVAALEVELEQQQSMLETRSAEVEEAVAALGAAKAEAESAAKPAASAPRQAASSPPPAPANSQPSGETGGWFVNFGSYGQRDVAESWSRRINGGEGQVIVQSANAGGRTVFRVRIVGLNNRDAAERVATRLEREYQLPRLWVGESG